MTLIVLAGNHDIFEAWCREHDVNPSSAIYGDRIEVIAGHHGAQLALAWGWWFVPLEVRREAVRATDRYDLWGALNDEPPGVEK